jgi:uncharacterized protein YodC (DUF2158 family)
MTVDSLFAIGEIVRLKGGGPWMTVIVPGFKVPLGTWVACTWFDGNKVEVQTFPPGALLRKAEQT